jgi:hypothetical protein
MTVEQIRAHLHTTCRLIGASFTLDEAEGEVHACIIRGSTWWNLVQPACCDNWLWEQQLNELQRKLLN